MCGIFAWSGMKPGQFNKHKFDITGIMNETRGEHSCGVTAEGLIRVGVKETKVYRDFIALTADVPRPKKIPVAIGHTRHATVGAHTEENAHPFGFGERQDGTFEFVGVHNGSLLNHEDLAKEFGIDMTVQVSKNQFRKKIDSEILLEILYTTGNFKVLSRYLGAAALIWQYLEEPDVVYYYHGESKLYPSSQSAVEERPLYFYRESKNSLYVSSIEASLFAIGGHDDTVGEFEHNTVYKVTKGDISKAKKYKISRATMYQRRATYPDNCAVTNYRRNRYIPTTNTKLDTTPAKKGQSSKVSDGLNIYREQTPIPIEQYKARIYFNRLRYWRNGHKITGIYTLVRGYGFYYLAATQREAEKTFWSYVNKHFWDGGFYIPSQLTTQQLAQSTVPFRHGGEHPEITNLPLYSFYDGIMLEHYLDYSICVQREKEGNSFSIEDLSKMSKHAIIDDNFAFRTTSNQGVFRDGRLFTGTICPLESSRVYTFEKGNLTNLRSIPDGAKFLNNLMHIVDEVEDDVEEEEIMQTIEDLEEEINSQGTALTVVKDQPKLPFIDNDLLEEDITKMFTAAYENFPRYKEDLQKYGNNARALQAMGILTTFLASTYQLLSLEPKE